MTEGTIWPSEIKVSDEGKVFNISFESGEKFQFSAEFLRVESPSAEVKGHGHGQEVTVPGKRNVKIQAVEQVGNYAVRIRFDDRHDTGLYSWAYLHKLGCERDQIWAGYLEKLKDEGKSRD